MSLEHDFVVHTGAAGVVADGRHDLAVVVGPAGTTSALVMTRSRTAGPCVALSREARVGSVRGFVVLARNANVATGAQGYQDAVEIRDRVAALAGARADELIVCSTGVIGRRYPMESIRAHLDTLTWPGTATVDAAATAIMTTDTHPKVCRVEGDGFEVVGIAKGVGMIEPDMATMLSFVLTDAQIDPEDLDRVFRRVVEQTYNSVSIDTDTSTSDTALLLASGSAGTVDLDAFERALLEVCTTLVKDIASDGEGASTLITCTVTGATSAQQARTVGKAVINSPLVKTMVHGADPNWGRVVMAVGKCVDEPDITTEALSVSFGGVEVFPQDVDDSVLAGVQEHLRADEVEIGVDLGLGQESWTVYGCDLTEGYVRTNADYTT
ncbi:MULTISPECIES: bifunctional glutamate N-acetyltransferase/amino-acid acetyltransferase ArgJ [unclassified Knoellia]|uniref:bifunctional glutamate N-acetyltransferase/amino-acid acetyltransferase ArgJ n=1 Tax=Knoellia altitudinis TaxID=3404795 RepID=UPI00361C2B16